MIEAGIIALLSADPTLFGLVGTAISPVLVTEPPTYPCLSYTVVAGRMDPSLDRKQWDTKVIQFDAWGPSYGLCKTVLKALRNVLNLYVGPLPDGSRIIFASCMQDIDYFENDSLVFRVLAEYRIQYVEGP